MPELTPSDEHFVHQLPEPLSVVGIEHQHWRESYFFVTHGPDPDTDVVVVAMATYPARHALDALVLGRVDGSPVFHHHQREAAGDPHTTRVGPVSVEVVEPFEELRVTVAGDPSSGGFEADLTFRARTRPYALRRGRLLADDGSLLWDQSHMIQSGTYHGRYRSGATDVAVDGWLGQRDHSWGVRDHGRIPLWMWLAVQLEDGMLGVWHWELANGARVFTDGCWAPTGGGPTVPVVDFHHDLQFTDGSGAPVDYGTDGAGVEGLAGTVTFTLAGGRRVTLTGEGRWCAPYRPFYGGGQHLLSVRADDGRSGTAVYEVTGRHHHRFFPTPPPGRGRRRSRPRSTPLPAEVEDGAPAAPPALRPATRRGSMGPDPGRTMAYSEGRIVHDADAHIMETPTWLADHADPAVRDRIPPLRYPGGNELRQTGDVAEQQRDLVAAFDRLAERHRSAEYRHDEAAQIMQRKNFAATGSFLPEDRGRALDLLGFSSQLVFNTFHNRRLRDWEHAGDMELAYGVARAHNRGMVEFCSADPRLLPTCYVPLADLERAPAAAAEALEMGAAALLVASGCPPGHSPSHVGLDPVWSLAEDAGVPVVFHVGGTGDLVDPHYFDNGLPVPPDFHGGEENFRSVDYMGIPGPPAQTLATMIFDGVLERFPMLRIGVIEQGAIWVPSWTRQMESAFEAFARHEERLQKLSLRPTEYVTRQVRVTPYPTEDVGWIVAQSGPAICMFSSDYPHVEGGRKPLERFEASLGDASEDVRRRFYCDNFLDLMGSAAAALAA